MDMHASAPTVLVAREHHAVYHTARPLPDCSAREETLSERGDESDFNEQPYDCFSGRDDGKRIVQQHILARRESPTVERGDAKHYCAEWVKRRIHIVAE